MQRLNFISSVFTANFYVCTLVFFDIRVEIGNSSVPVPVPSLIYLVSGMILSVLPK